MLTVILWIFGVVLTLKLYLKFLLSFYRSKVCMTGKVAIVTGGSSGIGYEIAAGLLSRGCRVIIADLIVADDIREKLIKKTNNENVIMKYVNFSSFKSVRKFAEEVKQTEEKIDILIHNAGTAFGFDKITEDNLNFILQVNYYSEFLLTHLLLDLLKKSSSGRIIFTASVLATVAHLSLIKPETCKPDIATYFAYPISKYYVIIMSKVFAEKLKGTNITSNCYHPGLANTKIFVKAFGNSLFYNIILIAMLTLTFFIGKTPEEAAQSPTFLACAKEVENVSGEYLYEFSPTWMRPLGISDPNVEKSIWERSEKIVDLQSSEKLL